MVASHSPQVLSNLTVLIGTLFKAKKKSLVLSPQGGIYIFQLIDYYGFNGACYFFMCLIETIVIGWIFGKCK